MIISFWSPEKGHGKCTSSLLAVASSMAISYQCKSLMLGIDGSGDIESAFSEIRELKFDSSLDGVNAILKMIRSNRLTPDSLEDASSFVLNSRLYYLNSIGSKRETITSSLRELIDIANKTFDVVWIDAGNGVDDQAKEIIALSDMTIVCIPQNLGYALKHNQRIKEFVGSNSHIVLVSDFEENSFSSLKKVSQMMEINPKLCVSVPHNVGFKDSVGRGGLLNFLSKIKTKNVPLFSLNEDELFLKRLKSLCKKLVTDLKLDFVKEGSA